MRVTELTPKLKCLWQQAGIGQCIIRFCPLHHGPPRFSQSVKDREWEERAFRSVGDLCTRMTRRAGFWSGEREQDLRGPFFRSDITNRLHLLLLHVLLCSILLAAINFVLLPNERLYGHVLRINFIPTPSSIAACRPTNFNLERNLFSGREGRRVMRETVLETIVASLQITPHQKEK